MLGRRTLRAIVAAGALVSGTAPAGIVQLACKGVFERSDTEPRAACATSSTLDDPDGGWINGFSEASADRDAGTVSAGAAGGAIRGVDYAGRESSAILVEQLRLDGRWHGALPVTLVMRLSYGFEGEGQSLLFAAFDAYSSTSTPRRQRAELHLEHTDLAGATVRVGKTLGRPRTPEPGDYARHATLEVRLVQAVGASTPEIEVRADINAYALPNLRDFDESIASLVRGRVEIELSVPCPVNIVTVGGGRRWKQRLSPARGEGWRCGAGG